MKQKLSILALSLLTFSALQASENLHINFKSELVVSGQKISLKDLIDPIQTSPEIISRYGSITLEIPQNHKMNATSVLLALTRAGADISQIQVMEQKDISLKQNSSTQNQDTLQQGMLQKLIQDLKIEPESITIEWTPSSTQLPRAGTYSKTNIERNDSHFKIDFLDNQGLVVGTANYDANITVHKPLLVAKKSLMAGGIANLQDFGLEEKTISLKDWETLHPLTSVSSLGVTSTKANEQRLQMMQGIVAGSLVRKQDVRILSQLQKGDTVTLLVKNDHFQISAPGFVKEVADEGARVLVENVDSKKEIWGKPVGSREVEVAY